MTTDAFFVRDGDTWQPQQHAVGPWSSEHLHGGPVAALMARALERLPTARPRRLTRIHLEFLRPVPKAPLALAAEVSRPGRSIERVRATLSSEGRVLCTACALRARTEATPFDPPRGTLDALPEALEPSPFPVPLPYDGYHTAMELRTARGTLCAGPVQVWMRARVPLVPGEAPSPVQCALVVADAASGAAAVLDWSAWSFLNADLDVVFTRPPAGDWIGMDAHTELSRDGLATCASVLHDLDGPCAHGTQALLLTPR